MLAFSSSRIAASIGAASSPLIFSSRAGEGGFDFAADVGGDFGLRALPGLLRVWMTVASARFLRSTSSRRFLVLGRVGLGVAFHLFDFILAEAAGVGDLDCRPFYRVALSVATTGEDAVGVEGRTRLRFEEGRAGPGRYR